MVFGYWAIFTAFVCVIGFSYMVWASFGEASVEDTPEQESLQSDSPES